MYLHVLIMIFKYNFIYRFFWRIHKYNCSWNWSIMTNLYFYVNTNEYFLFVLWFYKISWQTIIEHVYRLIQVIKKKKMNMKIYDRKKKRKQLQHDEIIKNVFNRSTKRALTVSLSQPQYQVFTLNAKGK